MGKHKKESLEKLLPIIYAICESPENSWFKDDLLLRIGNNASTFTQIFSNTEKIKNYLQLSPEISIDYSFINHTILKTRLDLDNLRMENIRINLLEKDEFRRLYDYIIYAFYQVENLINYYYHIKYHDINMLLYHLESIQNTRFNRTGNETSVADINIATKIYSFNLTYFNGSSYGYSIDNLRKVRNEGLHRCSIILKNKTEENKNLYLFLQSTNYDHIHNSLEKLTNVVKDNI